jgi:predicted dithiol-disulfide oxidoreductase (DUF899 family)
MLGPEDKEGCTGCSFLADNFPQTSHLNSRDTTIALVSRAPLPNIQDFKARMGWTYPWYSSFGTEFNYDFNATLDEAVTPLSYNVGLPCIDFGVYMHF